MMVGARVFLGKKVCHGIRIDLFITCVGRKLIQISFETVSIVRRDEKSPRTLMNSTILVQKVMLNSAKGNAEFSVNVTNKMISK